LSVSRLEPSIRRRLFSNLEDAGRYEAIFELAALSSTASDSVASASGSFVQKKDDDPLGWALYSEGNFATLVHPRSGNLQIDARAGSFGLAAERLVRLADENSITMQMASPIPENSVAE